MELNSLLIHMRNSGMRIWEGRTVYKEMSSIARQWAIKHALKSSNMEVTVRKGVNMQQ
jgi:hypothetical protein